MPTATRVAKLGVSSWLAIRRHQNPKRRQRKSLKLLSLVLRGPRKWKVLSVPRTKDGEKQPTIASARHGTGNGHGTAHKGRRRRMGTASLSIPTTLRPPME